MSDRQQRPCGHRGRERVTDKEEHSAELDDTAIRRPSSAAAPPCAATAAEPV